MTSHKLRKTIFPGNLRNKLFKMKFNRTNFSVMNKKKSTCFQALYGFGKPIA